VTKQHFVFIAGQYSDKSEREKPVRSSAEQNYVAVNVSAALLAFFLGDVLLCACQAGWGLAKLSRKAA
jgi:hypothetical protein